jgi:predicted N-formylglutamate amidohydrolase
LPEARTVIVTCEHGGNSVPARYSRLFWGRKKLLESHRGYDAGALELARKLSSSLGCQLYFSTVTRLLVDLNRSPDNPRRYSEITRTLDSETKENITLIHYFPYRESVEAAVTGFVNSGAKVLHISVHSFVPVLKGRERDADIGLLYDPGRKREARFCAGWQRALLSIDGSLRVRRNYPYRGTSDGLTAYLRDNFGDDQYIGTELEVNQRYPRGERAVWLKLMRNIVSSLGDVLSDRT